MILETELPAISPTTADLRGESKERILIVDDSPTIRRCFSRQLSTRYDCIEAASFMDALDQLRENNIAVVLADIHMPGISGVELLRKIVEKYPDTSVIMVSGLDRPRVALDTMRLGAFDYLSKPCDPYLLELTVERALEHRSLLRNAARYKADLEARNIELAAGKLELERLQGQIVQNAKMASLGQLAAGIAHELNNPVGFVYGNLDLIDNAIRNLVCLLRFYDALDLSEAVIKKASALKDEFDYEVTLGDLPSIISDCREGTERIRDIVQNLRTFSRLDEAEFKDVDIHEGIDSTLRILSQYFSNGRIQLVRKYADLPLIEGFSGQLNQVWMNLLANAAQAVGSRDGEIRITTRHSGNSVCISIKDTGDGINPEHLERIFDPFYTTKPVGEGTGLGLSISFSIIERHRGRIEVESEVSKGTTVTVTLPTRVDVSPENSATLDRM